MQGKLTEHGRCYMQSDKLLTKSHVELEDSSIIIFLSQSKPIPDVLVFHEEIQKTVFCQISEIHEDRIPVTNETGITFGV